MLQKLSLTFTFLFLIFFVAVQLCPAQTHAKLINSGLEKFRAGSYSQALPLFRQASIISADNPYADAALYLTAKTLIRLQRYTEASAAVQSFAQHFPASPYLKFIRLLDAEILFAKNDLRPAYINLIELYSNDPDSTFKSYLLTKLDPLLAALSQPELLALKEDLVPACQPVIDKYLKNRPSSNLIAVIYSPEDSSAAHIISGLQVALNLNQPKIANNPLELRFIEHSGSQLEQFFQVKELYNEALTAVICLTAGPSALLDAAAGSNLQIPLFILRDNTPGLWKIGDNIWQLSPDLTFMGQKFADFVYDDLQMKRFVTLAPLDDPRMAFAEAFISRINHLGGEVAASEWFYTNAQDLGGSFKNLRRIGFKLAFFDSLNTLKAQNRLFFNRTEDFPLPERYRIAFNDSFFTIDSLTDINLEKLWEHHSKKQRSLSRFNRIEIDSNDVALDCFDGFLFPFNLDEADMYINQFAFYNLKTNLLSLASSFTPEILSKHRSHLKNLKTVAWSNTDRTSDKYLRLIDIFISLKGRPPQDEEILGYDSMNFLLFYLRNRQKVHSFSQDTLAFKGVNYNFIFPPGLRANQSVNFFDFDGVIFVNIKSRNSLSEK